MSNFFCHLHSFLLYETQIPADSKTVSFTGPNVWKWSVICQRKPISYFLFLEMSSTFTQQETLSFCTVPGRVLVVQSLSPVLLFAAPRDYSPVAAMSMRFAGKNTWAGCDFLLNTQEMCWILRKSGGVRLVIPSRGPPPKE